MKHNPHTNKLRRFSPMFVPSISPHHWLSGLSRIMGWREMWVNQDTKANKESKISIIWSVQITIWPAISHKVFETWYVKTIGWRTKLENKCLHPYPTSHILKLTQATSPDSIHCSYLSRWLSSNSFNRKVPSSEHSWTKFTSLPFWSNSAIEIIQTSLYFY